MHTLHTVSDAHRIACMHARVCALVRLHTHLGALACMYGPCPLATAPGLAGMYVYVEAAG